MEKIIERYIIQARSYFEEYAGLDASRTELLREINKYVQSKGFVNRTELLREINKYVQSKGFVKEMFLGHLLEQGFYVDRKALFILQPHLGRIQITRQEYGDRVKPLYPGLFSVRI